MERHVAADSYTGAVDDMRVGTTIIFYLQNMGEFLTERAHGRNLIGRRRTSFTALASNGLILLPLEKPEGAAESPGVAFDRREMLRAAREGDEDAMESLTREDMDTYSMLTWRIGHEDVLTIVDTYFMPDGAECECYSILGTILGHSRSANTETGEEIVRMEIECNDIRMDVLINAEDLVGEEAVGRRFKGDVWLQGYSDFSE